MRKKNQSSVSSKYWLLILSMICILLMGLSLITDKVGGPLRAVANYTIVPMQNGINTVGVWISDLTKNLETLKELQAENDALKAEVSDLTMKMNLLQQDKEELERLRELYKLDEYYSDYKTVGARVTSNDSGNWFRSFVINKGKKDGIKVDMNVIAEEFAP